MPRCLRTGSSSRWLSFQCVIYATPGDIIPNRRSIMYLPANKTGLSWSTTLAMKQFIPGLELNRLFYIEVVQPLLSARFPEVVYSVGLLGYGSDVLGYDT